MTSPAALYRLPTSTRARRQTLVVGALVAMALAALACLDIAASRLAYLAGYASELGSPILPPIVPVGRLVALSLAGFAFGALCYGRRWHHLPAGAVAVVTVALGTRYPLYGPATYFLARRALLNSAYRPYLEDANRWGLIAFAVLVASASPLLHLLLTRLVRTGDLHGSARLATAADIATAGFVLDDSSKASTQSTAFPLGLITSKRKDRLVRAAGDIHVLLFAPPGAGKTTCYVVPTAQDWIGNIIVLDVKGEIAQATAGYRQLHGSRILLLDPSRNDKSLVRYNPLLSVRPHPYDVQDISQLAQFLVPEHQGADPFWPKTARAVLVGVLLHILYTQREKTLAAAYRFLCDPTCPVEQQFEAMLATEQDPSGAHGWTHHPSVETAARSFLDMPPVTRGGVLVNAQTALAPYSDPILAAATAASDFALEDLYKTSARPVALYLLMDPNQLRRLADHLRIVISQITAALTRELPSQTDRRPVLLLLDEFPVFGRMTAIEESIAYFRGYGVQAFLVVQHLGQLLAAYGQNQSISPNCALHVAFAPADLDTATMLSKRSGTQTIQHERSSTSTQGALRSNTSTQDSDLGRPLLMPEEIMRLPKTQALVLRTGAFPLLVRTIPFYRDSLRAAAAALALPVSEPTVPDFSTWLSRSVAPPPSKAPKGQREKRLSTLLSPEPVR
jgi:type IV secretion system protein VirD4